MFERDHKLEDMVRNPQKYPIEDVIKLMKALEGNFVICSNIIDTLTAFKGYIIDYNDTEILNFFNPINQRKLFGSRAIVDKEALNYFVSYIIKNKQNISLYHGTTSVAVFQK